jgi:hypothetical protein
MTWAVLEFAGRYPMCEKRAIADIVLRMRGGCKRLCFSPETERELRRLLANPPAEMSNPASSLYSI